MVKRITLFDGLTVTQIDKPIPKLVSRKADILLAYLAREQRPFPREQVATLLWPDSPQKQALSNLRTLISSLRKHAADFVTITRQTVAIKPDVWVDTAVFQQHLTRADNNWPEASAIAQAEDALALYHGEFLDGILVDGSFELESWMQTNRDHLRRLVNVMRQKLIDHYLRQGDYAAGIEHAHALLQDDPLDEAAHRQMMILFARSGQRSAAIEQYETCRRMLDEELGVEPDDETTALLRRIELADNNLSANLPVPLTTFVGRAQERLQIGKRLRDGQTRLLTLIGLGGIGKTRLAIQIAHDMAGHYLNGVYFVPLAPLESADFLVSAIAAAVHLDFAGQGDPKMQLFNHLREKELLLVLENVHTAWTYAVTGTDFDIADRSLATLALYYNHKGLFTEGAGLVETAVHRFEAVVQPENPAHCDLLSRLYAAWSELGNFIPHYDQAIAAARQAIRWGELGQNIKNQATGYRLQGWYYYRKGDYDSATEYAHKGMEMAQTLLAEQEVAAAARAMSAILVRQGSYRQAAEYAQHAATLFQKTGNYWGNAKALNMLGISYWYLGDYDRSKQHYQQSMSLYQELSNSEGETIALGNLGLIAVQQRNYEEAKHLYQRTLHNFRHVGDRWGESWALNSLGNLAAECMNFDEALRYCREAARVAAGVGGHLVESDSLRNLGYIHWRLGAYARADAYFRQSAVILSERSDAHDEGNIFHDRSWLAHDWGDHDTALTYAQQALAIGEANENMPTQAAALTALGNALAAMDDWSTAEAAYRRALPLWDNLQQPQRAVDAQAGLIRIALGQGDWATAVTTANEILAYFTTHSIYSVLSPFGAYMACVQALQAANDSRADEVLAEAQRALAETAVSIQNASLRRSYLHNVSSHRILQAM